MDRRKRRILQEAAVAYRAGSSKQADQTERVAAGQFKQTCLALLDDVAREHKELIVTKHGKPVAKLVPIESDQDKEARILASLRGSVTYLVSDEELLEPVIDADDWQVIREGTSYHMEEQDS